MADACSMTDSDRGDDDGLCPVPLSALGQIMGHSLPIKCMSVQSTGKKAYCYVADLSLQQ